MALRNRKVFPEAKVTTRVTYSWGPKRIFVDREESARRQHAVWIIEIKGERHRCRSFTTLGGEVRACESTDWSNGPVMWLETNAEINSETDSEDD